LLTKLNSWPKCAIPRSRALTVALLLALAFNALPAWAGKYAYGERFVRVGKDWSNAGPLRLHVKANTAAPLEGDNYQRQVSELELQGGPYSDALAEPLVGLGRFYQNSGDPEQAQRLYRRALHIVRVNDGLYSERQIPILRELLNGYRASGEWETLDERYDYYFRLYGNGQPPYSNVRLQASLGYMRWQREAVRLGLDDKVHDRLLTLYHLNADLLARLAEDVSVDERWYRELSLSQLRNLYLVEDKVAPALQNIGVASSSPMFADEWKQADFKQKRLEGIQRGALSSGVGLLRDAIARTETDGDGPELASLYLELGDWYQWHGDDSKAATQYRQVVTLLTDLGRQDLLQQWLGEPVELPDNGVFRQPRPNLEAEAPVEVSASYDVSARGRVRKLQAEVTDPELENRTVGFKRKLAQIRFRPRWISGEAEEAAQIERRYQLVD
jgi:hypothetical protein